MKSFPLFLPSQFAFAFLLLNLLPGIIVSSSAKISDSWHKFRCSSDEKCLRVNVEYLAKDETYYDSLNECRLLCGEYGALWPIPSGLVERGQSVESFLPQNVRFRLNPASANDQVREYVDEIQHISIANLYRECGRYCNYSSGTIVQVTFKIQTPEVTLTWSTDESYEISIETQNGIVGVTIVANTVFGARHALETLSQLTTARSYPDGSSLIILSSAYIQDEPSYPHRGFLLDTARNYISPKAIKRQLDGMASCKLNVLHWHITDSQSFPLQLVSFPQVTRLGAYSEHQIYTQDTVREIFQYARFRGIRVILEFDAPAHVGNGWQWGPSAGLGDLAVCINEQPWRKLCIEPPCGQFNPANPNLYNVLREVYADLAALISTQDDPGAILHMGGDEVFFGCWNATQEIVDYLARKDKNRTVDDFLDLWGEFQEKVLNLWDQARGNATPVPTILWTSHLTDPAVIEKYLPNDRYIIQTWVPSSQELPKELLKKGYRLIISTKDAWYFDHGFWGLTSYYQWRKVYNNKILRDQKVLGGEACIWTEFIDEHSLDSRTWPRLAAVAERLWSDPQLDASKVEGRFYRHRERLIARGLNPEAVTPSWCVQNESECQ
ncbi:chitooligosaccharidolytic beta-N-acetylglucosaminidase [Uranotaenia lowii]|uniref:chitooligosaccharidolytic beta-N-acetylglucosaminidase n=1 Tax=Uranotaenia lowii TaxID=190385 RepID=UPI002479DD79|nr:chitooligosaccharidolytic beta-N-acetylglucosaminidase [Uranotaenia lowii]